MNGKLVYPTATSRITTTKDITTTTGAGAVSSPHSVSINFQVHSIDDLETTFYIVVSRIQPLLKKAFSGLLKSRDFLGYQLDHALGNIDDESFNDIKNRFLVEKDKYQEHDLMRQIKLLQFLTLNNLDADTIEEIFNCELDDAEKALDALNRYKEKLTIASTYKTR